MEWNPEKDPIHYNGMIWRASKIDTQIRADQMTKMVIELVGFKEQPFNSKKEQGMNRSTTVFLVDNSVKAFKGRYEDGGKDEFFKTFDDTIKKDDLVVVESPARWGFSVVRVVETDVTVDIEDNSVVVKWMVSKVDLKDHKQILEQEAAAIDKVRVAEFNKKKRDLIANMASPEDAAALKAISVNPAIINQSQETAAKVS